MLEKFVGNLILLFAGLTRIYKITSTKIFSMYQYKMVVFGKPQTFNQQTSLFSANCKIQLLQTFPAIQYES